jgi:hypothetical protein
VVIVSVIQSCMEKVEHFGGILTLLNLGTPLPTFNKAISLFAMVMCAVTTEAASITLESNSSGVFQYQLTLAPGDDIVFDNGAQIVLTGLVGITATSPLAVGFSSCGFTDSTACFAQTLFERDEFDNPSDETTDFQFFTITSSATSVGLVNYTAGAETPFEGQVDGPVPPTGVPELGNGPLAASGLLGLALLSLRRHASRRRSIRPS